MLFGKFRLTISVNFIYLSEFMRHVLHRLKCLPTVYTFHIVTIISYEMTAYNRPNGIGINSRLILKNAKNVGFFHYLLIRWIQILILTGKCYLFGRIFILKCYCKCLLNVGYWQKTFINLFIATYTTEILLDTGVFICAMQVLSERAYE